MVFNPISYIKESKAEFDKVVWPSRTETLRLTILVTIISVVIGAYISGLDAILATLVERFLR